MSSSTSSSHAFVTTVLYPCSKPTGFRLLQSDVSPLVLLVAPRWDIQRLLARPEIVGAAAYVLIGRDKGGKTIYVVYFGESLDPKDRIPRHFLNAAKAAFVSEIIAICGRGDGFGKDRLLQFQHRLTMVAEDVGHARVVRGNTPAAPRRSEVEDAIGDRLFLDLRCMMIAAGCRILESDRSPDSEKDETPAASHQRQSDTAAGSTAESSPVPPSEADAGRPEQSADTADEAQPAAQPRLAPRIENGTYTIVRERLWAMAVVNGSVVLRAGSEVRAEPVETCPGWVVEMRDQVKARGLLVPIVDATDRWRLLEDLPVTSLSTAGKFVTGRNAPLSIWSKVGGAQ